MNMFNQLTDQGLKLRESIFVASNPTPGTGIAINADPTAWAATEAMATIYNSASVTTDKGLWIAPLYVRLSSTAAGTGSTDLKIRGVLDNTNRYSSGGTTLTSASGSVSAVSGYTNRTPKATINFGDVTAAAESSAQNVFNAHFKVATAPAADVGDTYTVWFGGDQNAGASSATAATHYGVSVPPVFIGPGSSLVLHPFQTSASAASSFEVEIAYVEWGHQRFE